MVHMPLSKKYICNYVLKLFYKSSRLKKMDLNNQNVCFTSCHNGETCEFCMMLPSPDSMFTIDGQTTHRCLIMPILDVTTCILGED